VTSERTAKLARHNFWSELIALRDRQREQRKSAVQVVRLSELPLESNEQGLMRWYLHPAITDTVLSTLAIYRQEIPPGSRSGRLKFQGGQILFIVAGRGHIEQYTGVPLRLAKRVPGLSPLTVVCVHGNPTWAVISLSG